MLKLKRIDLLTKKDKIHKKWIFCDHVKGIRNLSACVENSGEFG
jgi:hypothetical protein